MNNPFYLVLRGIYLVPQIIILAISFYYFQKKKTSDGLLMIIGTFIGLSINIFYTFIYQSLYNQSISKNSTDSSFYTIILPSLLGVVGFIGSTMFAVGVLILIKKTLRSKKKDDDLDDIGNS